MTTVEKCSRVAVLQDGQILETGGFSELTSKQDGYFARLASGMKQKSVHEQKLVKKASSKRP